MLVVIFERRYIETDIPMIDKTVKVVNHKPFFFFKLLKKFCRALMKLNN